MKKALIAAILIAVTVFNGFSQKQKDAYQWPGYVRLNDSVFIMQTEVSIRGYGEYLLEMKLVLGSYDSLEKALPNPAEVDWVLHDYQTKTNFMLGNLFDVIDSSSADFEQNRFPINGAKLVSFHYASSHFPVVNVTREHALLYCSTLTRAYYQLKQNTKKRKGWVLPDSVHFRLPSMSEWFQAFNEEGFELRANKERKRVAGNVIISSNFIDSFKMGALHPSSVYSGFLNKRGIVNLCGNVSEILMDEPGAFGGSFKDSISSCSPLMRSRLSPPQSDIGFRVVAVIVR